MFKYKLYLTGMFNRINPILGVFAAINEEFAIKQAREELNLQALPCEAKEIVLDGFIITVTKEEEDAQDKNEQPIGKRGAISKSSRGPNRDGQTNGT